MYGMDSGKDWYYAVYDALKQPPVNDSDVRGICGDQQECNRIGIAWSLDGLTWDDSTMVALQAGDSHPCGQPLGLVAEPELCTGCYSVLFTGITDIPFRPVCSAIIRNVNEY